MKTLKCKQDLKQHNYQHLTNLLCQDSSWLKEVCTKISAVLLLHHIALKRKQLNWTKISTHGNATGSRHVKYWLSVLCSGRWNSLRYTVVLFRKEGWVDPLCRFCRMGGLHSETPLTERGHTLSWKQRISLKRQTIVFNILSTTCAHWKNTLEKYICSYSLFYLFPALYLVLYYTLTLSGKTRHHFQDVLGRIRNETEALWQGGISMVTGSQAGEKTHNSQQHWEVNVRNVKRGLLVCEQ